MATETKRKDVYSIVTERILELLAKGVAPWHKPWNAAGGLMQYNYVSKKPYRGINVWMLAGAEYTCPFWLSYKQTSELGGEVTKGEHGYMIVYFQWVEPKDSKKTTDAAGKDHKPEKIPLLRYYMVWNLEQTTLWEKLKSKILPQLGEVKGFDPIAECEAVLPGMPNAPVVTHKGPSYLPFGESVR